jgi:hypothetical protein
MRDKSEARKEWRRDYQFLNKEKRNLQEQIRRAASKQRALIESGEFGGVPRYSDASIFTET